MRHIKFSDILKYKRNNQIPARRSDLELIIKKKKETGRLADFAAPAGLSVKIKESEKIDKYLYLAKELKKCVTWE